MAAPTVLTPELRSQYTVIIDEILASADLETISSKNVRRELSQKLGYDVSAMKTALGALIGERFDRMAQPSSDNAPTADEPHTNGFSKQEVRKEAQNGTKREASDDAPGMPSPEESDFETRPKKKQRKQPDDDAKLAAKLQAEENSRARPTRGGGTKKFTPVKKKKTPKKKSEAKIKGEDDSDLDMDSDGEKKERPKTGAFHKEYILSAPLAELVHEPQLSRPQVVKKIWEHIKSLNLQDPNDKRQIMCDDKMYAVFKTDKVHMFTMNKLLGKQLYPIDEV